MIKRVKIKLTVQVNPQITIRINRLMLIKYLQRKKTKFSKSLNKSKVQMMILTIIIKIFKRIILKKEVKVNLNKNLID